MGRALEEIGMISRLVTINSRVIQMTISSDVERKVGVLLKPGEAYFLGCKSGCVHNAVCRSERQTDLGQNLIDIGYKK